MTLQKNLESKMFITKDKPFLIAELSANHCGKISKAKKLIYLAKKYGADAVKLQTYTADTMTIKSDKNIFKISSGLWKGYTLWDLYEKAKTPLEWHEELFNYGKKIGIKVFSTPYDESAVLFLEKLNCQCYKISSFEITDHNLIKKIAKTRKPLIISTGMANLNEIQDAYRIARKYGSKDITLLYCVSNYPSKKEDFNLNNIKILKENFKCRVGLSDHSKNIDIAKLAVAAGAEVIEKHIALGEKDEALDREFSLLGKEIIQFRHAIDDAYKLLGKKIFYRDKSENINKKYRRSIFAIKDIKKGEKFTKHNVKCLRPNAGIEPRLMNQLIGKKSPKNIKSGLPIKLNIFLQSK